MTRKKPNNASRFFATVSDLGSLFMAFLYTFYVSLLLIFKIGTLWLNYSMLGLTIVFLLFFVLKIFLLNRVVKSGRTFWITNFTLRYIKWGMKIINAVFVALSLANIQLSQYNIVAMVGIIVVGLSFFVSVLWDIGRWVARRKLLELKSGWDNLTARQKKERVEMFMSSIIKSLDGLTGLELAKSADEYINKRVAVASGANTGIPLKEDGDALPEQ